METVHSESMSTSAGASVPSTTRLIVVLATCMSAAGALPGAGPLVVSLCALVPQSTIGRFYLWNVVTAGFIEVRPALCVVTLPALVVMGRWIEPVWGGKELAVFALVVNASAGLAAFASLMFAYAVSRSQTFIFTPVGGLSAIVGGLLVAVKQLIPDHSISAAGVGVRVKFLPIMAVAALCVLAVGGAVSLGVLVFTLAGFQFGWLYLRFFQRREVGQGDPSDAFAFCTFFPEPIAPFVSVASAVAFAVFRPALVSGGAKTSASASALEKAALPVSSADPIDAERRRQRALRALDERLGASKSEASRMDESV